MRILGLVAAGAMAMAATSAGAASYHSNVGLSGADVSIDFEAGLPQDTLFDAFYAAQGVTFVDLREDYADQNVFANTSGADATNFSPCCTSSFEIHFTSTATDAVFTYVSNESATPSVFQAYLGGSLVESFDVFATPASLDNVYGFVNSHFDKIVVLTETSGDHAALIDNLQFNNAGVPEPATWAMMILGFGLAGGALRSRRRLAIVG